MKKINVTIWNEFRHEKTEDCVKALYPDGIHAFIKGFLDANEDMNVRIASLDEPEQGLPDEVLESTDVLLWWGHMAHREVSDALVEKIRTRVLTGKMGFVPLHSAHRSKPFMTLLGTNGNLSWGRDQKEIIWNMLPAHDIAAGVPDHFLLECEELYSEPFFIPQPDELIFGGWFEDGHIMRAGATFYRGAGKIFYFQPGHESCRAYYHPHVQRIITNAIRWVKPNDFGFSIEDKCPHVTWKTTDEFDGL